MPKDRRSFFERLTGSVSAPVRQEDYFDEEETEVGSQPPRAHLAVTHTKLKAKSEPVKKDEDWMAPDEEGQLTVDVYQKDDELIVQSTVAGVRPDDLDVQITREMITVRGKREQAREIAHDDYYYQELYWGSFSRSILLPCEVDVDGAEASLKNGLLTIKLPKMDKNRSERLKVKNE